MTIHFEKSFLKDIKKLNDKMIASNLKTFIEQFEAIDTINNLQNIKKLKGHNLYYRLKIRLISNQLGQTKEFKKGLLPLMFV